MSTQNREVSYQHWGTIAYKEAWDRQEQLAQGIIRQKTHHDTATQEAHASNYVIFCHHPHVYTLGRNGNMQHLLLSEEACTARGIAFFRTNRGGDITYHGPGQIVVYPLLDLENFFTDVHRYMRSLEESVVRTLRTFGVESFGRKGLTGVWTRHASPRKIASIGVRISRWVTMHGLALNVDTNLSYFDHIIACGIDKVRTTSLAEECRQQHDIAAVEQVLKAQIYTIFGMRELQDST